MKEKVQASKKISPTRDGILSGSCFALGLFVLFVLPIYTEKFTCTYMNVIISIIGLFFLLLGLAKILFAFLVFTMKKHQAKGANEAVFYGCRNQSFINFILSFGFKKTRGTFSDISILAPRLKTAAVNISCGYENAHEKYEHIDIQAMKKNTERLVELIQVPTNHFKYHA